MPRVILHRLLGLRNRLALAVAVLGLVFASQAQAEPPAPDEGIVVGPWVLVPQLFSDFGFDSNLLKVAPDNPATEPLAERGNETGLAFSAMLPFKNSMFEFDVEASRVLFSEVEFQRTTRRDFGLELDLQLSSKDRLRFRERFLRDFIQIRDASFDGDNAVNPEDPFVGEPYNLNRWDIELERNEFGHRGYRMRVSRRDYNYEGDNSVSLYNYRGFDNIFEYTHPMSSSKSLLFHYNQRRFNHYAPDGPVGVPFRKEITDIFEVGVFAQTGAGHQWLFRGGYQRLEYEIEPSTFRGFSGVIQGRIGVGGRSGLTILASRRTLPSTVDAYYTNNALRVAFDRSWTAALNVAAGVSLGRNIYDESSRDPSCGGDIRRDDRVIVDAGTSWAFHPRLAFNADVGFNARSSNCDLSGFQSSTFSFGLRAGWF